MWRRPGILARFARYIGHDHEVIVDARALNVPALAARHESVDVRLPGLRMGLYRGRNVASDFTLLERAMPFVGRIQRSTLTIVFQGFGRFDERGRQAWLREGDLVVSHSRHAGTEAYAGASTTTLAIDWEPDAVGVPVHGPFAIERLSARDVARMHEAALRLASPEPERAVLDLLEQLRAIGLPFAPIEPRADGVLSLLQSALSKRLTKLDQHPDIEDVATDLGWNRRLVHRRMQAMAEKYGSARPHWREALHSARLLQAMRLLAAPGATTELVAKLCGFRSPGALCHAFAEASWPSPGAMARAARDEAISSWTAFVSRKNNRALEIAVPASP